MERSREEFYGPVSQRFMELLVEAGPEPEPRHSQKRVVRITQTDRARLEAWAKHGPSDRSSSARGGMAL